MKHKILYILMLLFCILIYISGFVCGVGYEKERLPDTTLAIWYINEAQQSHIPAGVSYYKYGILPNEVCIESDIEWIRRYDYVLKVLRVVQ